MITAILLGFLGLFLGMVGLRCTSVGNIDVSRKAKLLAIAGALHILAGNGGEKEHTRGGVCLGACLTLPFCSALPSPPCLYSVDL